MNSFNKTLLGFFLVATFCSTNVMASNQKPYFKNFSDGKLINFTVSALPISQEDQLIKSCIISQQKDLLSQQKERLEDLKKSLPLNIEDTFLSSAYLEDIVKDFDKVDFTFLSYKAPYFKFEIPELQIDFEKYLILHENEDNKAEE